MLEEPCKVLGDPRRQWGPWLPPHFLPPLVSQRGGGDKSLLLGCQGNARVGLAPVSFRAWPSIVSRGRPKVGRRMLRSHPSRLTDTQEVPVVKAIAREPGGQDGPSGSIRPAVEGFSKDGTKPGFGSPGCPRLMELDRGFSMGSNGGCANRVGWVVI